MANFIPRCEKLIRNRLDSTPDGRLPWAEVMAMALYEPGAGYYRQGSRTIGREGDFYTSVSIGPLFGELLAWQAAKTWRTLGQPAEFTILEQGAHDGALAADILGALRQQHPELYNLARYVIIEPDEVLAAAQRERLAEAFPGKLQQVSGWAELGSSPVQGLLVCNELLDAFPVHLVKMVQGEWQELWVESGASGELQFVPGPLSDKRLVPALETLGTDFPEGYTTEINLGMLDWLEEVAKAPFRGVILLADYGLAASEYYAPERSEGTLRRYFQHRTDSDVLRDLGDSDLTTHVNFTELAEEAEKIGLGLLEFLEQGRFLSLLATEKIAANAFEPTPARLRQFQALTHPNHLGFSFQIMLLGKGMETTDSGGSASAARRRLGLPAI